MKFLKRNQLNFRNVKDNRIAVEIDNEVKFQTTNVALLPVGTNAQRPTSPTEGHVRYNITNHELEVFQGSTATWKRVAYKEPSTITQQELGVGNDIETIYGPLDSGFNGGVGSAYADYTVPVAGQNIIVVAGNVIQLKTHNYELIQNPPGLASHTYGPVTAGQPYPAGWYIQFGGPVPLGKEVVALHGFDR